MSTASSDQAPIRDEVCRQRRRMRFGFLLFLFAVAGLLIWMGFEGWTLNFIPAEYVGYFFIGFGLLGLCGVNIWRGGPLDIRDDPTGDAPPPQLEGMRKGQ